MPYVGISYNLNIVQTILHGRIIRTPTVAPLQPTPCDHDRCNLYAATNKKRVTI